MQQRHLVEHNGNAYSRLRRDAQNFDLPRLLTQKIKHPLIMCSTDVSLWPSINLG